jgi:Anti-sigma factor NepR
MNEKRGEKTEKTGDQEKVQAKGSDSAIQKGPTVAMHDLLGDKLRAYYNEVANAPVPDRFALLLKELETKSDQKKQG